MKATYINNIGMKNISLLYFFNGGTSLLKPAMFALVPYLIKNKGH